MCVCVCVCVCVYVLCGVCVCVPLLMFFVSGLLFSLFECLTLSLPRGRGMTSLTECVPLTDVTYCDNLLEANILCIPAWYRYSLNVSALLGLVWRPFLGETRTGNTIFSAGIGLKSDIIQTSSLMHIKMHIHRNNHLFFSS